MYYCGIGIGKHRHEDNLIDKGRKALLYNRSFNDTREDYKKNPALFECLSITKEALPLSQNRPKLTVPPNRSS